MAFIQMPSLQLEWIKNGQDHEFYDRDFKLRDNPFKE